MPDTYTSPWPPGQIAPHFLGCPGNSGSDGSGCAGGFNPMLSVTMPEVGLPQVNLTLPDFSGMTIEGILKALEMIGISPCAFIQAVAGGVTDMMGELESALQNSINQIADLPADIVNGIANEAQTGIDNMAAGLDLSGFDCEGLVGAANKAAEDITNLDQTLTDLETDVSSDITTLSTTVNDATIGNAALDTRLTNIGA